jgi:hypothetical protein
MSGCTYEKNQRLTLGGAYQSPAIFDHCSTGSIDSDPRGLFSEPVTHRTGWESTSFVVHFDGVVHGHLLRLFPGLPPDAPARAYGRFPSESDALDPQEQGYTLDLRFTMREYGRSLIGSDYSFIYLLTRGELFEEMVSPFPYKRSRAPGWSSGQPSKPNKEQTNE